MYKFKRVGDVCFLYINRKELDDILCGYFDWKRATLSPASV